MTLLSEIIDQEPVRPCLIMTNNSHKWWSTLKNAVFGARSTIPPLVGNGGALVSDSASKADLFVISEAF